MSMSFRILPALAPMESVRHMHMPRPSDEPQDMLWDWMVYTKRVETSAKDPPRSSVDRCDAPDHPDVESYAMGHVVQACSSKRAFQRHGVLFQAVALTSPACPAAFGESARLIARGAAGGAGPRAGPERHRSGLRTWPPMPAGWIPGASRS